MNRNWKYQDIIDLEYFFQQDGDSSSSALHARDRRIYLNHVEAQPAAQPEQMLPDAPSLLKIWLAAQRAMHEGNEDLPGTMVHEAHGLLRLALIFFSIFAGGSAGLVFFSYSGTTPVNVLHFLVLFIFSQLVLAAILLARSMLLQLGLRALPKTLAIRAMAALATRIIAILHRQSNARLTAGQRLGVQAAFGKLRAANTTYSTFLYWPLFLLIQLAGICFNLGLLGTTFLKVMVSDVAFGWQSTLQFSSQTLHSMIAWIALPWSWIVAEGTAYPTLAEIEGSRIILKEGIANLQTPDLVSWWPFLLLCLLVYGLLLRLSLYGYGWFQLRRAAANLEFTTPAARQVIRRMQTPVVSTQAQPEPVLQSANHDPVQGEEIEPPLQQPPANPVLLLLPDEIFDQCSHEDLGKILHREGYQIDTIRRFMVDYESDQQLLEKLAKHSWNDSAGLVIVMEAWMPPLVSFQSFVKALRQSIGTGLPIMLRLVGKPGDATPLTPVKDETLRRIWRQKMESLGDAYLETRDLIEEESV